MRILQSCVTASLLSMAFMTPVQVSAQDHNMELYLKAYDYCHYSPGYEAMGYSNAATCTDATYQHLLYSQAPPPGCGGGICDDPSIPRDPGDGSGCNSAETRICRK